VPAKTRKRPRRAVLRLHLGRACYVGVGILLGAQKDAFQIDRG
jgi:hypothetical protein